jgi:hypothetical protein
MYLFNANFKPIEHTILAVYTAIYNTITHHNATGAACRRAKFPSQIWCFLILWYSTWWEDCNDYKFVIFGHLEQKIMN